MAAGGQADAEEVYADWSSLFLIEKRGKCCRADIVERLPRSTIPRAPAARGSAAVGRGAPAVSSQAGYNMSHGHCDSRIFYFMKGYGMPADTPARAAAGARSPSAKSPPLTATPARLLSSKHIYISLDTSSVSARISYHRGRPRRQSTSAWCARRCGMRSWPSRVRWVAHLQQSSPIWDGCGIVCCVCAVQGVARAWPTHRWWQRRRPSPRSCQHMTATCASGMAWPLADRIASVLDFQKILVSDCFCDNL